MQQEMMGKKLPVVEGELISGIAGVRETQEVLIDLRTNCHTLNEVYRHCLTLNTT